MQALPASCGDCIWIEFGHANTVKRALVDGGKIGAYPYLHEKVRSLRLDDSLIHLIIVTHVDADHIEGVVGLLTDERLQPTFGEIWFNGWPQIRAEASGTLGITQGELLGALLSAKWPGKWNYAWADLARRAIHTNARESTTSRNYEGMSFTLLSPDPPRLERLRASWDETLKRHELTPGDLEHTLTVLRQRHRRLLKGPTLGPEDDEWEAMLRTPFASDTATNNGGSLAFLAELDGMSCLLLGDAFPDVVHEAITKIAHERRLNRLPVSLMKVSHHGSRDNTHDLLLDAIDCKHFLFSTDGSSYGHPDQECVARIVQRSGPGVHLYFNTDFSGRKAIWNDTRLQTRHQFHVHYPSQGTPGITVNLSRVGNSSNNSSPPAKRPPTAPPEEAS